MDSSRKSVKIVSVPASSAAKKQQEKLNRDTDNKQFNATPNSNSNSNQKPWGKLTSLTMDQENINLIKDSYTIGRKEDNDVVIKDSRLSAKHCKIFRDESGNFFVEDLSTYGTYIEDQKIGKQFIKKIESGDKIFLINFQKAGKGGAIGYVFSGVQKNENPLKHKRDAETEEIKETKKQNEKLKKLHDSLQEEMMCSICMDYLYQCVTVIPCLHNFCAACLSEWLENSKQCPQCREVMVEVKKNAAINNMTQKFLDNCPEKKRSPKEYQMMDKKNKIKQDRLVISDLHRNRDSSTLSSISNIFREIPLFFCPPLLNFRSLDFLSINSGPQTQMNITINRRETTTVQPPQQRFSFLSHLEAFPNSLNNLCWDPLAPMSHVLFENPFRSEPEEGFIRLSDNTEEEHESPEQSYDGESFDDDDY